MKKHLKAYRNHKYIVPVAFIILFAILGVILLITSRAATPSASIESENGTSSGSGAYTINNSSTASGGKYVEFGSKSTSTNAFVAGVCSPSPCTQTAMTSFTLTNVPDSSAPPYGNSTPATRNWAFNVERPTNLKSSPAPPLVIVDNTSIGGSPDWQAAAAKYGFVFIHLQGDASGNYRAPTIGWNGTTGQSATCGTSGTNLCSSIPYVQRVIQAVECPYTGSGPCQGVNNKEVYVSGSSSSGLFMEGVACDSRTAPLIAGVQVVSDKMQSPGRIDTSIPASQANAMTPNCPTEFGIGPRCFENCNAASLVPNHNLSWQYIWGTVDSTGGSNGGSCVVNNADDCLGNGFFFTSLPDNWYGGIKWDAGTLLRNAEGCSATATTATMGQTNSITSTTYSSCSNSSNPSGTAIQLLKIANGAHIPDTWPCGSGDFTALNGIICASGANTTDVNASDGLSNPAAAYEFWSTYPG